MKVSTRDGKNAKHLSGLNHGDPLALLTSLRTCIRTRNLETGIRMHADLLKSGLLEENSREADILVSMYAKTGLLSKARNLLVDLLVRDVFSWTDLIAGYADQGQGELALDCFEWMRLAGISPDSVTFSCTLEVCGSLGAIERGTQIHEEVAKQGLLHNNVVLGTALLDMYAKCGALKKAQEVLNELPVRDVCCWTALITGFAQHGESEEALSCFTRMRREGLFPDALTFCSILKACGSIEALEEGEQIHSEIVKEGILDNDIVLGTALVDMYTKCGFLARAQGLLRELPARDTFSWTALIAGSAEQGFGEEALNNFEQMQQEGIAPDVVTWASVLKACGSIGAASKGEQIHDEIARQGLLQNSVLLGNALVDMYAKCGALEKAQGVLQELPSQEVVSWNALITGYAEKGQSRDAFNCFEQMQVKGLSPDAVTCLSVLNACSHSGLVDEGQVCFASIGDMIGNKPNLKHYNCMIDLFGRAGRLENALNFIEAMPSLDFCVLWITLLGACQKWGNLNFGRRAFDHAVQIDNSDRAVYVLMRNIYMAAGMQEDAEKIETMRVENCRLKQRATAFEQVDTIWQET